MYDRLEKLQRGEYTPIPANKAHAAIYSTPEFDATDLLNLMFAGIGAAMASGDLNIDEKDTLNALFPDRKTIKVVDFIEKYWGGKGGMRGQFLPLELLLFLQTYDFCPPLSPS